MRMFSVKCDGKQNSMRGTCSMGRLGSIIAVTAMANFLEISTSFQNARWGLKSSYSFLNLCLTRMCGLFAAMSPSPLARNAWSDRISARYLNRMQPNMSGMPRPYTTSAALANGRMVACTEPSQWTEGSASIVDTPLRVTQLKGAKPVRITTDNSAHGK